MSQKFRDNDFTTGRERKNLPLYDRGKMEGKCMKKRGCLKIWSRIRRFWEQNRLDNYC